MGNGANCLLNTIQCSLFHLSTLQVIVFRLIFMVDCAVVAMVTTTPSNSETRSTGNLFR